MTIADVEAVCGMISCDSAGDEEERRESAGMYDNDLNQLC